MFRLTQRQVQGLANMEAYLGIRNPRTDFTDQEAFTAYWEMVARRCDTTTRVRATETPAIRAEQQRKRQEQVTAHYQDATHLYVYGREYAQRYQPSAAKLRQQLVRKSANEVLSDQVMLRLSEGLDDRVRALELAEIMQHQGKHVGAIRSKLRQRLFSTDVIEHCVKVLTATATGSLLEPEAIARKVRNLQRKGLSQQAMRSKLMGHRADAPVITAALADALGDQGDTHALRLAIAKLSRKKLDVRATTQRLVSKGFRYADVVRALAGSGLPPPEGQSR